MGTTELHHGAHPSSRFAGTVHVGQCFTTSEVSASEYATASGSLWYAQVDLSGMTVVRVSGYDHEENVSLGDSAASVAELAASGVDMIVFDDADAADSSAPRCSLRRAATGIRARDLETTMRELPSHLHDAYNWTAAAGELEELRDLTGEALATYCEESVKNAQQNDTDISGLDLHSLHEYLVLAQVNGVGVADVAESA